MDIDEEAFRRGRVSARLYGYLKVPLVRRFTQGAKAASSNSANEEAARQSIAEQIVETMKAGCLYIIVAATPGKLASLQRRPLLIDTGDNQVDEMLRGYVRVVTGFRKEMVYKIA